jgi:hypothetical protein
MELKDVKDGQIFYCCLPSLESMDYDDTPVPPRQMKAMWRNTYGHKILYLNSFDSETGKIDEDSSSAVIVENGKDIFLNLLVAQNEYKRLVIRHVKKTMEDMMKLLSTLELG